MAKDFLSSQIRTSQIIASRSLSNSPSLLIISSSNADGDGGITPSLGAGADTFFFVSGSKSNDAYAVFGGNVKISGSLIAQEGLSGSLTKLSDGSSYLVAGTNVTITSASNGSVTISSSGGGGGAPTAAQYLVLSYDATLTGERLFSPGSGLLSTDNGANSTFDVEIDDSVVATISGSTFTGPVKFNQGLSGSLTKLSDGSSYLVAGTNVTIASASNGSVTIASSVPDTFFTSTTNGSIFTTGSLALRGTESSIDSPSDKGSDVFFYVSGSITDGLNRSLFGGQVVTSGSVNALGGLSGSLTKLIDGSSYLVASSSIEIVTASNGSVKISAKPAGSAYEVQFNDGANFTTNNKFFYQNNTLNIADLYLQSPDGSSSATIETDKFGLDIELVDNSPLGSSLNFKANGTPIAGIQRSDPDRYMHLNSPTRLKIGTSAAWEMELYYDTDVSEGYLTNGTGPLNISSAAGIDVTGPTTFNQGLSGSLTHLTDGSSYLVAGSNVTITSASNGSVTIAASGGGGGTPSAPNDSIQFNNAGSFGGSANLKWIDGLSSLFLTGSLVVTGSLSVTGSILPGLDTTYDLGSPSKRWANVYTGDLHLRNERGHWTIVEESDFLCVINNLTGKKYKMMLEPID